MGGSTQFMASSEAATGGGAPVTQRMRIFGCLVCRSHDDNRGNAVVYGYESENSAKVFEASPVRHQGAPTKPYPPTHKARGYPLRQSIAVVPKLDADAAGRRWLKRTINGTGHASQTRLDTPWPADPRPCSGEEHGAQSVSSVRSFHPVAPPAQPGERPNPRAAASARAARSEPCPWL